MLLLSTCIICAVYTIYKRYEPSSLSSSFLLLAALPYILATTARGRDFGPPIPLVILFGCYWASLLSLVVGYRLSPLHPLASFPGPTLCKISNIWLANVYRGGKGHLYLQELHDKFGDVVRIGPNELSFRHENAINPILAARDSRKGPYYTTRRNGSVTQIDGILDTSVHSKRRKAWTKGTSTQALQNYEELLRGVTGDLLQALKDRQQSSVDLAAWMGYITFDFLGEIALSKNFGNVKTGSDCTGLINDIHKSLAVVAWLSHIPWALEPMLLLEKILQHLLPLRGLQTSSAEIVQNRLQAGTQRKDLFHYISNESDTEFKDSVNLEEAAADGTVAIVAGSDTSAVVLSHLFYFLFRHPKCMERLRQEIDSVYPPGSDTTEGFGRQIDMPYLTACLNETMRLFPPGLSGFQRRIDTGRGGRFIGSRYVPDGTQVSVHLFSLQRDPRYFHPLPEVFWPDRFLNQDSYILPSEETIPKEELVHNLNVFLPFSTGPMNCAGRAVAMMEMRAVMCAVLHEFEISVADGFSLDSWEENLRDVYLTSHGSLMVRLKTR